MKDVYKIILVAVIAMMSLLLVSCGSDDQADINNQPGVNETFPAPNGYGYQQYGYQGPNLYGYSGADCGSFSGFGGYNGYSQNGGSGNYPEMGHFLQGNPNAPFRYNGLCYTGQDLYNMYGQYSSGLGYSSPRWDLFFQSPYAQFQLAYGNGGYGSGLNYVPFIQTRSTFNQNYNTNWDFQTTAPGGWNGNGYGGGYGGYNPWSRNNNNSWYVDFDFRYDY